MEDTKKYAVVGLKTDVVNRIYEESARIEPIICLEGDGSHTLEYRVVDYFGNTVKAETLTVVGNTEHVIKFDGKLNRSHYTVSIKLDGEDKEYEEYFSVVADTDKRKRYDNFISVDVAGFFLARDRIEDYAKALYLAGVTHVRERDQEEMSHLAPEKYDFSFMDRVMNAYRDNGIRVMPTNHTVPVWAREEKKLLPDNIINKYNYFKAIAARYNGEADWELWNEPDLHSHISETADCMAAMIKASAIAVRDFGPDSLAVLPGFAAAPGYYSDRLMENEVYKYVDTYSFHGHRGGGDANTCDLDNVPTSWERHFINADKYDLDDHYIYNTEAGIYTPMDKGTSNVCGARQRGQARYLPASMIQGAAMGADKQSFFVFPAYAEQNLQWGMFAYSNAPFASYNALAAFTYALGKGEYINSIPSLPVGVHGEVFKDGDDYVAAFWSRESTCISVKTDANEAILTNIMGVEEKICSDNGVFKLTVSPDILYLRISAKFCGVNEKKFKDRTFKRHELTAAERVIIEQRYPKESAESAKTLGYKLNKNEETEITVIVTNLNGKEMCGKVSGKTFDGWMLIPEEQEVKVGKYGQETLTFKIKGDENVTPELSVPVIFEGFFNGEKTSRCSTRIMSAEEGDIKLMHVNDSERAELWEHNVSPDAELKIENSDKDTLLVNCKFAPGDKWLFPLMHLTEGTSFEHTKGMSFDIRFDSITDIKDMPTIRIFAYENNGSGYYLIGGTTVKNLGWNNVRIKWSELSPFDGAPTDDNFTFDDYEVCRIAIGVNATVPEITYSLKNISVFDLADEELYSKIVPLDTKVADGKNVFTFDIVKNGTGIVYDTLCVKVDGEKKEFSLEGDMLTYTDSSKVGTHDLEVKFRDESGRIVQYKTTFENK